MLADKVPQRFEDKVFYPDGPLGCWEWMGARNADGYGQLVFCGRWFKAHRFFYEVLVGAVPQGLEIDHLCRNRACVNPDHMETVTHQENIRRGDQINKGWERYKTHCPKGHAYTEDNLVKQGLSNKRKCKTCHREKARINRIGMRKRSTQNSR